MNKQHEHDVSASVPVQREAEDQIARLYWQLIYAVATKHPDESRHETALRYIRERERPSGNEAQCQESSEPIK